MSPTFGQVFSVIWAHSAIYTGGLNISKSAIHKGSMVYISIVQPDDIPDLIVNT